GFAVIAGEVRKLSQSSAHPTTEAENIVERLKDKIREGGQSSQKVSESFNEILGGITETVAITGETTGYLKEQNKEILGIKAGITSIFDITNELQNSIKVQNNDMNKFNESFKTLSQLSTNLTQFIVEHEHAAKNINGSIALLKDISNDSNKNSSLLKTYLEKDNVMTKDLNKPIVENIEAKKVGFVFSAGGLGDDSYNDMMFSGFVKLRLKGFFPFEYISPREKKYALNDIESLIEQKGCKFIIVSIGHYKEVVRNLAKKYPQIKFALIDDSLDEPLKNVSSILFYPHESSYLSGCLAALQTRTGKVGFIGGTDIPALRCFLLGYEEGIQYLDPKVQLEQCFLSADNDFTGFNNPEQGYQMARQYYQKGVDIIFAPAGHSTTGVIKAAKEMQRFIIGVDVNQDALAPGYVLTSAMKRVDNAVYRLIQNFLNKKLQSGKVEMNLNNNGVSLTDFKYTKDIIGKPNLQKLKDIENKIKTGKIVVPNYLKLNP
ncbi:MAG: BMP family ABC transporter substrate-binding protein, partial [Spirochaetes bacterium]|nr:BMP family ABC transporter substrate-binding protein [Spirochaetota bacterium]